MFRRIFALKLSAKVLCRLLAVFCCVFLWTTHSNNSFLSVWNYGNGFHDLRKEYMDRLHWAANVSHGKPDEVKHIVFIKVHKAASTTMFNLLIRFAMSRDLNVMFPKTDHHLSEINGVLNPIIPHPPSPPFYFDILCNHVVFREDQIRPWFPRDTHYITILRRPWDQVVSAFYYYRAVFKVPYLSQAPSITEFLLNRRKFEPSLPLRSFTNNRMSLDLGLPLKQLNNVSYIPTFIDDLQRRFSLVLIAEQFDKSLVLLKRRFGWTMKDIVYLRLNAQQKRSNPINSTNPDPNLKQAFDDFNRFDVAIYNYFIKIFVQEIVKEGPGFLQELQAFTKIQTAAADFCSDELSTSVLKVSETKWNEAFTLERKECVVLSMDEVELHFLAKANQLSKYRQSNLTEI